MRMATPLLAAGGICLVGAALAETLFRVVIFGVAGVAFVLVGLVVAVGESS
jgi:hypothetical protein